MNVNRSVYAGLFCLAASVLILEISLTRIFSVLMWGHYSFLVISTALLGFGAAGSRLAVRPPQLDEVQSKRFLARNCTLFAVTLVASVMICTRLGYQPNLTFESTYHTLMLPAMYTVLVVPFYFAGLAIGFLLSSFAKDINTVYFADLAGAGVGALAITFLLGNVGAPAAVLIAGALALVSGLLFLGSLRTWVHHAALAAYVALLAFVAVADPWRIPVPEGKALFKDQDAIEHTEWSLLARIDFLADAERPLDFGCGVSKAFLDRPVAYMPFFMDGSNPSRLIKYDQDLWFVDKLLSATPYALGFEAPRVLIIGSGGGIDTLVAVHHDASHVTAVEINPKTVELVKETYADYTGRLYDRPNVELLAEEGRHFLTLDESRYDVIRLTGVDTRAASAMGANAKDHAYIYTLEAAKDLFEHLSDDGVLAFTRPTGWMQTRLLNVLLTSLEELGIEEPARHLAVVNNRRWCDVLVSRKPLREEQVQSLATWAASARMSVTYDPFQARTTTVANFVGMTTDERRAHCAASPVNLTPVTDDSPFFFEPNTLGAVVARVLGRVDSEEGREGVTGYKTLLLALAGAVVLSVLLILIPLIALRSKVDATANRGWSLLYFSALGLGFILAELIFIQKYMIFLGGPIYSLSVTLFSILVFSGLGAFAAKRIDVSSPIARASTLLAVVGLLLLTNAFLRWGLPHLLGLPFGLRVLLGIASLAPVSFVMGMPFPMGIGILERSSRGLISWAWGTNACLTVIGSVLSVIISMNWGFYTAMMVATGCYVLAGICLMRMRVGEPAPEAATSSCEVA